MVTAQLVDVLVIGGGPGGYTAAIRASQLGLRTALVDASKNAQGGPALGGTCTNVGCIPSKALLQTSELFEHARLHFAVHGIVVDTPLRFDLDTAMQRKAAVVKKNNDGIAYLFKKNKIAFFHGYGKFVSTSGQGTQVRIVGSDNDTVIDAKHVIVASGSTPRSLPQAPFDEVQILSNDGALRLRSAPKRLAVIGAGVVGLELGSVWRRVGADVTVLEYLPTFLGAADRQIADEAHRTLSKQGLRIELGVEIGAVEVGHAGVRIGYTTAHGDSASLEVDAVIELSVAFP